MDQIVYHPNQKKDHFWGASSQNLNDWFPLDQLRGYKRGYFQIFMKDKSIRPCFSPCDPVTVLQVLSARTQAKSNLIQPQVQSNISRDSYQNRQSLEQNPSQLNNLVEISQKQKLIQFETYDAAGDSNILKKRMPLRNITNEITEEENRKEKNCNKKESKYKQNDEDDEISFKCHTDQEDDYLNLVFTQRQLFQDMT